MIMKDRAVLKAIQVCDGWMDQENLFIIGASNKLSGKQLDLTVMAIMEYAKDLTHENKMLLRTIEMAKMQIQKTIEATTQFSPEWYLQKSVVAPCKEALKLLTALGNGNPATNGENDL